MRIDDEISLNTEVYRKPTHINIYSLIFITHKSTGWGVISESYIIGLKKCPPRTKRKEREQKHIREAVKICG